MGEDVFSTVINAVNENIFEKKDSFVSEANFHEIVKKAENNKIAFIDGGQAELLKAVNFSLQFIRTAGIIFQDNKKIKTKINEFFVLVSADESLNYKTEIFSIKGKAIESFSFNSLDKTLMDGIERADVSKIASVIRRFAELDLAKEIVEELDSNDIIVLDGSLKCLVTNEKEYMEKLKQKANEKEIIVSSLAKTSKILMENGSCLLSQLNKEGTWYYLIEDNVYAVKLNQNSKYVFEFNIFNKDKIEDVLGLLIANSNDVVFPGYAYGLILADKIARVSNEEKNYLLTQLQIKAGKDWNKIKQTLNILNSHEILDNIC